MIFDPVDYTNLTAKPFVVNQLFDEVSTAQAARNKAYNEQIDKQNFFIASTPVVASNVVTGSPPSYGIGTTVRFTTLSDVNVDEYEKDVAEDKRRNLKLFLHMSKQFITLYPNWQITPSVDDPFQSISLTEIRHGYIITSAYPSNEIRVTGVPGTRQIGLDFEVVNMQLFFGWAIGSDEPPLWVTH